MMLMAMLTLTVTLYAQGSDPVAVVTARTDAINAGDVEAAIALFAEDAIYNLIPPPPGVPGTLTGREAIRARLAELVAQKAEYSLVETPQVAEDTVTALTRYSDDGLRSFGVDFIEGTEEFTVQDGKITSYTWTMTEESLAKLEAALPSPEALPESGGETFPVYTLLMVLGSLAILGGFGLVLWHRRWHPHT